MSLIYLASPYTHEEAAVREQRFDAVCEYAAKLMRAGLHVFSPIAHGHAIARYNLPVEFDFWQGYCEKTLGRCDRVVVLQLDGWRESKGVTHEVKLAKRLRLPVEHVKLWQLPVNKEGV